VFRADANTGKLLEIASFLYAAIDLLNQGGLLDLAELDEHKEQAGTNLVLRGRPAFDTPRPCREAGCGTSYRALECFPTVFHRRMLFPAFGIARMNVVQSMRIARCPAGHLIVGMINAIWLGFWEQSGGTHRLMSRIGRVCLETKTMRTASGEN
jgi:hypothetical protein